MPICRLKVLLVAVFVPAVLRRLFLLSGKRKVQIHIQCKSAFQSSAETNIKLLQSELEKAGSPLSVTIVHSYKEVFGL